MLATTKIKWIGTIILASFLLALALTGGKWGTSYSADASVNAAPIIESIFPSAVPAGSGDTVLIISGSNFGDMTDTGVRLTSLGYDGILHPLEVIPDGLSVVVTDTLLAEPTLYIVTVVKSVPGSIPTIPITPWDEESNPLPFRVFIARLTYLPIIDR